MNTNLQPLTGVDEVFLNAVAAHFAARLTGELVGRIARGQKPRESTCTPRLGHRDNALCLAGAHLEECSDEEL